jgi:putative cell wall-binding protein
VVLARADDFPDALAGSGLAAEVDAPILLTPTEGLAPEVADEIERLGASTAYLLGGTAALSEEVADDLEAMDVTVERVGGAERFETAALVMDEVVDLGGDVDDAIVALGGGRTPKGDFPDALAAGNLAAAARAPIVLVGPDEVPDVTAEALARHLSDGDTVYVTGGTAAVGEAPEQALTDDGYDVQRLAGAERYATGAAVTREALAQGAGLGTVVLATGQSFADPLTAAPAARQLGGVMLLVDPADLDASDATRTLLEENRAAIETVLVTGGPATIADDVVEQVRAALQE